MPPLIEFPAKVRDVNIDDVVQGCRAMRLPPNLLGQHRTADRLSLMSQKAGEKIELPWREGDLAVRPRHAPRSQIKSQIRDLPARSVPGCGATKQDAHSRKKFREREWLDQIVVSAALQSMDAILHGIARGQEQHRGSASAGAQTLKNCDTASAGQHPIQNHGVELPGAEKGHSGEPLRSRFDLVSFRPQPSTNGLQRPVIILDDNNPRHSTGGSTFHRCQPSFAMRANPPGGAATEG